MTANRLTLYFDGGARPNPGVIETAVVVRGVVYIRDDCGSGTNDEAEWCALLEALEVARSIGATDIVLRGDSVLVVSQASGIAKCRSSLLHSYLDRFGDAVAPFTRVRIRHIKRSQNLAGIALDQRRR
jgi:ribonuclease HI